MGKTTLLPPHHRIVPDRNRGGGEVPLAGGGASASGHGGGRGVGKRREEVEGNPSLSSPREWRRRTGEDRRGRAFQAAAACWAPASSGGKGEQAGGFVVQWRAVQGPFIGLGR
jgi:hypothetical protein